MQETPDAVFKEQPVIKGYLFFLPGFGVEAGAAACFRWLVLFLHNDLLSLSRLFYTTTDISQ
jgi:hypothetical protein